MWVNMKRAIREYWGRHAPYIDVGEPVGSKEFYEAIDKKRYRLEPYVHPLINFIAKQNELVLEVGCGLGYELRQFAKRGANVVGIDISSSNSLLAKRGLKVFGLDGEIIVSDAEHLPFKNSSFDNVYSFGVLHHTPNTQGAINEIFRVLRQGGRICVMLYHRGLAYYWILVRYGLLELDFLRLCEEQLISNRYDGTPLSKMYTRRQAKAMFSKFDSVSLECVNFGGIQENPRLRPLWYIFNKLPPLQQLLGSFIIIRGYKP
jgi:SAM-dependent methyltransferase